MEYKKLRTPLRANYRFKENAPSVDIGNFEYFLPSDPIEELHYHSCIEIAICLEGEGSCYVNDKIYHCRVGDVQIIMPYQPHFSNSYEGKAARWSWVSLSPYRLMQETGLYSITDSISAMITNEIGFSGIFSPHEYPTLANTVKSIIDEVVSPDKYSKEKIALLTYEMCIELSRISKKEKLPPNKIDEKFVRITPTITYIHDHLHESNALSLPELAKISKMSVSNFRRIFTSTLNMSPKEYIIKMRITKAQNLLISTKMSILDISLAAGFDNFSCFSRMFNKISGQSPSHFRENNNK